MDEIERLSEAIRFRTVAGNWEEFSKLKDFLERCFPMVHSKLKVSKINEYALLYEWDVGSQEAVLLLAHTDVVPASEEGWVHHPFSGDVADGFVWGRGTLDDKSSVMGLLEAVERLLSEGFEPRHNLLLAFGFDEETKGYLGAKKIAEHLQNRKIRIRAILDEGSAIVKGVISKIGKPIALIGIAEKGYASFDLVAKGKGGHSSTPERNTPLERMANAIQRIFRYRSRTVLTRSTEEFLKTLSRLWGFPLNVLLKNPKLTLPLLEPAFSKIPSLNAMLRTTMCVTMINAGVADNVVPEKVVATVNCRIIPGETAEQVFERLKQIVEDLQIEVVKNENWQVSDPVPDTDPNDEFYRILSETIQQTFLDVVVSPYLTVGATDSRHYKSLCQNIYRFSPLIMDRELLETVHGKNERVSVESYKKMCDFYTALMKKL
ncbi:MAG: carboxypeptidase [Pseudothermotoga sp.]|nr:MAG: Gly-Xaa carboxypeptidase [Thermotoga sp. 50_64]MBC7121763.1 M20/M25/M40 family metallo-hydrolase [Pseudothermotoga sp.]MDK2924161.1 carboxypeptidase [Pseudothermotoga sp.]